MDNTKVIKVAGDQYYTAIQLILGRVTLSDPDLPKVSIFFPLYDPKISYGNNTRVRWGINENGKWLLYVSTRAVAPGGGTPDVTPGSWKLLG